MPFEPKPGETVLFPAPFVPTEPQVLVISNTRVVQFAAEGGMYPVAEIPIDKIEHVGRMSERPNKTLGIVAGIVGVVFLIVFVAKVLPAVMFGGAPAKTEAGTDSGDGTDDGIEGRDANDDDPFEEGKENKEGMKDKAAKRLKKVKSVSFGWPGFTEDIVVGFLFLLGGGIALLVAKGLYGKEIHMVFCRVGDIVYPIEVANSIQQNSILATIQAAKQAIPR